jgi:hypothetical protein
MSPGGVAKQIRSNPYPPPQGTNFSARTNVMKKPTNYSETEVASWSTSSTVAVAASYCPAHVAERMRRLVVEIEIGATARSSGSARNIKLRDSLICQHDREFNAPNLSRKRRACAIVKDLQRASAVGTARNDRLVSAKVILGENDGKTLQLRTVEEILKHS